MAQDMSNDVSWAIYPCQLVSSPCTLLLMSSSCTLLLMSSSVHASGHWWLWVVVMAIALLSVKDVFVPVVVMLIVVVSIPILKIYKYHLVNKSKEKKGTH